MLRLTCSLAVLLLTACPSPNDDEPNGEPNEQAGTPEPGQSYRGGTVTSVTPYGQGCRAVVVQHPPLWDCSAELKSLYQTPSDPVFAAPRPGVETRKASFDLAVSSCGELAQLRRPGLKAQAVAKVEGF